MHLFYAWSNVNNPFELKDLIRLYYPEVVKSKKLANAEIILYKKSQQPEKEFSFLNDFENNKEIDLWEYNLSKIDSTSNNNYFVVNSSQEFPLGIKSQHLAELKLNNSNLISFKVQLKSNTDINAILVLTIENNDSLKEWRGTALKHYSPTDSLWINALVSIYLKNNIDSNDKIKAYVWNKNKQQFLIDNVELYTSKNNPYYLK